ncbi:hypothetical protein PRZ48_005796 [Zasmidium cellare]|uniref:Uncharacterized protein n=1 Tax=Zasmidium cellare TaxID=395010 RepID=A0ABR0EMI5_ZASCE|nr:hypothetical protein PRZ48_005796 [Zasmidium cellare]
MGRHKHIAPDISPRLRRQQAQATRRLQTALRDERAIRHQRRASSLLRLPSDHPHRSMLPARLYPLSSRSEQRDPRRSFVSRPSQSPGCTASYTPASASAILCILTCLAATLWSFAMNLPSNIEAVVSAVPEQSASTCEEQETDTGKGVDSIGSAKLSEDYSEEHDILVKHMRQAKESIKVAREALLPEVSQPPTRSQQDMDAEAAHLMSLLPGSCPKFTDSESIVFAKDGSRVALPVDNSPLTVFTAAPIPKDHTKALRHPARVTKDTKEYKPDNSGANISQGEVGYILDCDKKAVVNKVPYIEIRIPRRHPNQQDFWIPADSLEYNKDTKWGDIKIHGHISRPKVEMDNQSVLQQDDLPITRLAYKVCSSIMLGTHTDHILPKELYDELASREVVLEHARKLGKAVERAGISNAFAKGQPWSINDFRSRARDSTNSTDSGVYMAIYSDFKKGEKLHGEKPRNYIGKTDQTFSHRWTQHRQETAKVEQGLESQGHYRIAAQAKRRHCVVLAIADESWTKHDFSFAEQMLILILRAYRPEVVDLQHAVSGEDIAVAAGAGESLSALAVTLDDRFVASELTAIAERVFSTIGWGGHLETSGGCNWKSPFLAFGDDNEPTLWVKVDAGDRWCYFRKPKKPRLDYTSAGRKFGQRQYFNLTGANYHSRFEESAQNPGPDQNTNTYISIEIMKVGRHRESLTRLPDIGGPSNWDQANQVAVRVQWQDPKRGWLTKYIQFSSNQVMGDTQEAGALSSWATATAIRNKMERRVFARGKYDPPVPKYWQDYFVGRVLEIRYDAFEQAFVIKNAPPSPNPIPFPTINDSDVRKKMEDLGLQRYGLALPDADTAREWGFKRGPNARTFCDTVAILRDEGFLNAARKFADTGREPEEGQCEVCFRFGRRCTFTHDTAILKQHTNNAKIRLALIHYPVAKLSDAPGEDGRIGEIKDPGFTSRNLGELDE